MSHMSHVPMSQPNRESNSFLLVRPQTCHHHHTCPMSQPQSVTGPSSEWMSSIANFTWVGAACGGGRRGKIRGHP
jgi:hypothetical protein